MQFLDVVGQGVLKQQLAGVVKQQRVGQAYLFLEQPGFGGLPLALAFAQFLNCEQTTDADSCGQCPACIKTAKGIHADVHFTFPIIASSTADTCADFMDEWRKACTETPYMSYQHWVNSLGAENKQGNITSSEVARLLRGLSLTRLEGKYKVQLIWGLEFLQKEGNKLLKMLEEPPEHTVFLMVAQNSEAILPTILSRTQLLKVPPIAEGDIATALQKRLELPAERAVQVAALCQGNWQLAAQLADESENEHLQLIKSFLNQSLRANDIPQLLKEIDVLASLGRVPLKQLLEYMLHLLRRGMLHLHTGHSPLTNADENTFVQRLAPRLGSSKAAQLPEQVGQAIFFIERNGYPRLVLFNLSMQLKKALAG